MALEGNLRSLVHSMAYPGPGLANSVARGEAPEAYLISTVKRVLDDPYFGCIEVTTVKSPSVRAGLAAVLKASGKMVLYSCQPVQFINEDGVISPQDISSTDELDRARAVDRIKECIDEALELGASSIALVSGRDCGTHGGLRERALATAALVRSLDEICTYAALVGGDGFRVTMELFDRLADRGCKNQLVGPSDEAAELARVMRHQYGHKGFGLLYDLSHMPLIKGVSFAAETPAVISVLAPYLNHVHVGNCVLDADDALYGDTHPPFGYAAGAVGPEMLADFVKALHAVGYAGPVGFEVSPRGQQVSDSIVNSTKAWFDEAVDRVDVNYAMGRYFFQARKFMPPSLFEAITEMRISNPGAIREEALARVQRPTLTLDGKLTILAADHPGRNVTRSEDDPVAMGDRTEYLSRIVRVMSHADIDGLMATPDIIDDLFILSWLMRQKTGKGMLDGKVLVGCMNRGGLAGAAFEMDDRMTAYTAKAMKDMKLDAAKTLYRYEPQSRYSLQTMKYCSDAVNECTAVGLPMFLEPLPVYQDGGYKVKMLAEDMIRIVGVASAMGSSSAGLWIKIPYVEGYQDVVKATTLPILMLGGESTGDPTGTLQAFEKGMAAGPNVRGALVGRNVLFPGDDDPLAVALAVSAIVHRGASTLDAVKLLAATRGRGLDVLAPIL